MKTSKSLFIVLIVVTISAYCWGDWKSELTKLGFYTVISGKAISLNFKMLGEGLTERSLSVNDFPNLPTLKKGDFLALYGEMPVGPLDTTVEVFKYNMNSIRPIYGYRDNMGDVNDFFNMIPQPLLKSQKLFMLTLKENIKPSPYFLHKYQGGDADAYAGFQIGEAGGDISKPSSSIPNSSSQNDSIINLNAVDMLERTALNHFKAMISAYDRRAVFIANYFETTKTMSDSEIFAFITETLKKIKQTQINEKSIYIPKAFSQYLQVQSELGNAISRLFNIVDGKYPEISRSQSYQELRVFIEGAENRITVERQHFNEVAQEYNSLRLKLNANNSHREIQYFSIY